MDHFLIEIRGNLALAISWKLGINTIFFPGFQMSQQYFCSIFLGRGSLYTLLLSKYNLEYLWKKIHHIQMLNGRCVAARCTSY